MAENLEAPAKDIALMQAEYRRLQSKKTAKATLRTIVKEAMEKHVLGDATVVDYYCALGDDIACLEAQIAALQVILSENTPH